MAFVFTDDNFDEETKEWIVLIDFWAPWCWPCQMLGPVVEEIAEDYKDKVKVWKMNVDENANIPQKFWIMWIPAIKIFKDWEVAEEITWFVPKETISAALDKLI